MPRIARDAEGWDWLREAEIVKLLGCLDVSPEQRRIFAVAIFTGLRQGELWGLRWSDVDIPRAEIRVAKSYDQPTKGGRVRRVPLLEPALEALKAQPRRCSLVFPLPDSQMRHRGDTAGFHEACVAAKVRRVRFHDLRHSCGSHLVQGTWAPTYIDRALRLEEVRMWLGHRSIRTTERYAHHAPDSLRGRVLGADRQPEQVPVDFAEPSGLDGTHGDSGVSSDVAQLAEIAADWRREPDSNRCVTVLQTDA
jgi:integrase